MVYDNPNTEDTFKAFMTRDDVDAYAKKHGILLEVSFIHTI